MDDKFDVYIVVVDADSRVLDELSRLAVQVDNIAQDVDEQTAYETAETVADYWNSL